LAYYHVPLDVTNATAFSIFNRDLVLFNQTEFSLVGSVLRSKVESNIGVINAVGMPIDSTIPVQGTPNALFCWLLFSLETQASISWQAR